MSKKGGRWCLALQCRNDAKTTKRQFFSFPDDPARWLIWVNACGRCDLILKRPAYAKKNCRLCSDHFEPRKYLNPDIWTRLMPSAIPTLNLPVLSNDPVISDVADNEFVHEEHRKLLVYSTENFSAMPVHEDQDPDPPLIPIPKLQTSSIRSQTQLSLSTNTPRKRKLKSDLKTSRVKIARLQNHITDQIDANTASVITLQDFEKACKKYLPHNFANLTLQQARIHNMKDNRYSNEFKQKALTSYFQGPKVYKTLSKSLKLPSVRCLQRYTEKWDTMPGLNYNILAGFELKGQSLSSLEMQCILCADEMSLKSNLFYNLSKDRIVGFYDIGDSKKPILAQHVLVLMARGITVNWKQPLGYYFVGSSISSTAFDNIVRDAIEKLFELDFTVRCVIMDMGSNFKNFVKERNITDDQPYFMVNEHKFFFMYDVPHMIKAVRNNLLKYDYEFGDYTASWDDIETLYKKDSQKAYRMAPKLTPALIDPIDFQRMKVKYATQVISATVATSLSTYLAYGELPARAAGRAGLRHGLAGL